MTEKEETKKISPLWIAVPVMLVLVGGAFVMLPNVGGGGIAVEETAAIGALRTYLGAQTQFRRKAWYGEEVGPVYANPWDGNGFSDLYRVGGPDSGGKLLKMVDRSFAEAVPGGTPRVGYLFCDIVGRAGVGPYDYTKEFGLCAYPSEFSVTGYNIFIMDVTGIVYQKLMNCEPVTKWPDLEADGWIPVGS